MGSTGLMIASCDAFAVSHDALAEPVVSMSDSGDSQCLDEGLMTEWLLRRCDK